jgi:hypothetical protein
MDASDGRPARKWWCRHNERPHSQRSGGRQETPLRRSRHQKETGRSSQSSRSEKPNIITTGDSRKEAGQGSEAVQEEAEEKAGQVRSQREEAVRQAKEAQEQEVRSDTVNATARSC